MSFKYPLVMYIGIPVVLILALCLHLVKRKKLYKTGTKAANTKFAKAIPAFKALRIRRKIFAFLLEFGIIGALVTSSILAARPYKTDTVTNGVKKRDIYLCLDVSYSIYDLNYELVDSLEAIVDGLKGDRFGITIFNTSSLIYVPMTDDYDFVKIKLEELKKYFTYQKMVYSDDYKNVEKIKDIPGAAELLESIDEATLVRNYKKGSSLIGEGLASCLYSFPRLDESDRTRCIIMTTDNNQNALGTPLIELEDAADKCKKKNVRVFGVYPSKEVFEENNYFFTDYTTVMNQFKKSVEKTGGTFYQQSKSLSVKAMVDDIQKQEAKVVDEITITKSVDQPFVPMIILLCFIALILVSGAVLMI